MQRIDISERIDWRTQAEQLGFQFHTINEEPYWVESAFYQFTLRQIEDDIESPAQELHEFAMDLVDDVVRDSELLTRLEIPEQYWDWIARSWQERQPHLYGRIDFAYTGASPGKLLEFNYDTPTSLYEAAYFQWLWLEQIIARGDLPADADQFNAIQELLIDAFRVVKNNLQPPLYFSSVKNHLEDRGTVLYLRDCAAQAGISTEIIDIEDIGLAVDGRFTDLEDRVISSMFKLYPLEHLFRERFGPAMPNSKIQLFEPPWKAVLSNKGVLPLLWARHPNHPNLLEAHFEDRTTTRAALSSGWVRKPIHSREGANVELITEGGVFAAQDGPYGDAGFVRQRYAALPKFGDYHAVVGAWMIADRPAGMGMREDTGLITRDSARFVPHAIVG
jgi:glutathionylspermidine synthase